MENKIVMIKTEELYPHPDNPRKNLGDLTELTESIRKNGVLQNLTVVPADKGYMVVIGHRRCAAAEQAGLEELPCIISDMDYKTQIHTMLTENMQRSDLTLQEQAQGFQMMLDLGSSISEIVHQTGISESTVRHRLKLTELDQKVLGEKCAENINMFDLIKLEQIKDPELKNEVLKTIGTADFNWKYKNALQKEKNKARLEEVERLIEGKAEKIEKIAGLSYKGAIDINASDEDIIKKFERLQETADELFYYYNEPNIFFYTEYKAPAFTMEEADPEEEERKARREQNKKILDEKYRQIQEMWLEFIENVPLKTIKKNMSFLLESAVCYAFLEDTWMKLDRDDLLEAIGIDMEEFDELEEELQEEILKKRAEEDTNRLLLLGTFLYIKDICGNAPFDRYGEYNQGHKLGRLYDFLTVFGYRISEEEQAMIDGTHENYND